MSLKVHGGVDDGIDSVSVVIPTFNRAKFLGHAMRSVLDQSHRVLELIVVDDGSTDDTGDVVAAFADPRVRFVRIPRSGSPARARNVGIGHARGRFLAFLDSDDVWKPSKIERQLRALRESPLSRWSYTLFDHIDGSGAWMAPLRGGVGSPLSGWILEGVVTEEALVMVQSVLAESSLVEEVGGFDEAPHLREDLDFCLRLAERSPACAVDGFLLQVRHHPDRTTFDLPEVREWRVHALRKLARRSGDPRVSARCRSEIGREYLDLARAFDAKGRPGSALRSLARALPHRGVDPRWWVALGRILVRPLTTERMRRAYRRLVAPTTQPDPEARQSRGD